MFLGFRLLSVLVLVILNFGLLELLLELSLGLCNVSSFFSVVFSVGSRRFNNGLFLRLVLRIVVLFISVFNRLWLRLGFFLLDLAIAIRFIFKILGGSGLRGVNVVFLFVLGLVLFSISISVSAVLVLPCELLLLLLLLVLIVILVVVALLAIRTLLVVVIVIFVVVLLLRLHLFDLDWRLEELVQDLVDLAVEDLAGDERVLATSVVAIVLVRHHGDVVDEDLELVVVEVFDELVIVVFELLQAVIVVEQFVDRAVLVVQQVLDRRGAGAPVVGPEVAA